MTRIEQRHIVIALAASALLHLLLLWQVPLSLPEDEPDLPPLQAKLEKLPEPAAVPPKKVTKLNAKRPKPQPPAAAPVPQPEVATTDQADTAVPTEATAEPEPDSTMTAADSSPPEKSAPLEAEPPPLPKHAMLKYKVRLSDGGFDVGDVRHLLEIQDGHYTLTATIRTIGLARLVKNVLYNQTSRGTITHAGFQPDYAQEDKNLDGKNQNVEMFFDHTNHILRFSQGGETALTDDAQDRLSMLYQLSRFRLREEALPLAVTNGRKLERYRVSLDQEEEIMTPMGKLRTLPVRKIHGPDEEGLEIWLALEYRLLPVKVVRIERDGSINGVMVIQEIRLSDE
ncbi:hypothetical protein OYT1_ch2118 [Ferriphaselus amnicola]|uniref:DUF3108 domain-containing protein n=1 Tax=Ferriphaselus amnicola TaxID=1188319 RepID=A0A2Z6GDF3_9PROT|nr:DUF3108 domain-containing protein [Ferriphaselus amnicola]BBE51643.1 hypothetical protein OYT1_ch2118 [Ferriphaselus amnicola]